MISLTKVGEASGHAAQLVGKATNLSKKTAEIASRSGKVIRQLGEFGTDVVHAAKSGGLRGVLNVAKSNPSKAVAALVSVAAISGIAMAELQELAGDSSLSEEEKAIAKTALERLVNLFEKAGLDPDQDGVDGEFFAGRDDLIADKAVTDVYEIAALLDEAGRVFQRACHVVGGCNNLLALLAWFQIDPDLQQIVVQRMRANNDY